VERCNYTWCVVDGGWTGHSNLGSSVPSIWNHRTFEFNCTAIAILAVVIFKRSLSKLPILGLCAGFGGLMLLVAPSLSTGELSPVGTTALVISTVLWALGSLYSTKSKLPVSTLASSGMIMITGGLMLAAISLTLGEYRGLEISDIIMAIINCLDLSDSNSHGSWLH
jgi:drug/metabolite transporter (DMT)-like permease